MIPALDPNQVKSGIVTLMDPDPDEHSDPVKCGTATPLQGGTSAGEPGLR